jgi:tyrosyl-tRNA synthetase
MGGSDQWGNIVTGTELIRRKSGGEAFALTSPLITKSDGSKFGKTEKGNIWLDPEKTSPYQFYQFWLNSSDEDSKRFIRIFTFIPKEEVEAIEKSHNEAPEMRLLQKRLAKELTVMVHSEQDYLNSVEASQLLFGQGTADKLKELPEKLLLEIMDGVPQMEVSRTTFEQGVGIIDLVAEHTTVFPSKGEARKMIQAGGVSVNKMKFPDPAATLQTSDLIRDKYLIVQKGKKNYFLIKAI